MPIASGLLHGVHSERQIFVTGAAGENSLDGRNICAVTTVIRPANDTLQEPLDAKRDSVADHMVACATVEE
jgi:hypothetical protein